MFRYGNSASVRCAGKPHSITTRVNYVSNFKTFSIAEYVLNKHTLHVIYL